ncbi:MAG: hypothetical protein H6767_07655 [Candidatus Peribacteria bacterium]|nr:MAG: hypothetical protein H6767_07655 [Candidatus Peribacteria bacterium]
MLNDCNSGVQTSILQNIPDIIKDEWVAQESIRGVEETGSATNSCNRTVSRKE